MSYPVALPIVESSQVGEARRIAFAFANHLGFSETERGNVSIVVTELANNLVQHAHNGQLLLQAQVLNSIARLEILALDSGPGMRSISECLRDGFSTRGTLGNGLGACQRLSNFFDIYSVANGGTAILSHLWTTSNQAPPPEGNLEIGCVCLPVKGEEVSGDAWATEQQEGRSLLLVADGLGHGPQAAIASNEAVRVFRENASKSPKEIIEAAHGVLRSTRGAVMAIAEINFHTSSVRFAGVGNISAAVISPDANYSMVSYNGTVGHEVRKIQEFVYQWPKGGLLVMHSDGLGTQWHLERYAGLVSKHSSLIAGVLYRDFTRGRDDVTVLAAK
ncbi:MAG TPA: SpoIIE family protein phosphatase [Kamptonema sp.]|nr:SpoIIE family protein phosphatase [Kamptonema sp.]